MPRQEAYITKCDTAVRTRSRAPEATRTILGRSDATYIFETVHTYNISLQQTLCRYDSHAGKYHHLSPWTFCAANPIRYSDPTGKDAMFTVEGNNITVTANIFIHGDLATKELAKQYQDDIYAKWGSVKEYEHDGTTYNVIWDVRVKVMDKNGTKVWNGINNYMEVMTNDITSEISDFRDGKIRNADRGGTELAIDNPMSHEFGHMLGLDDKYAKSGPEKNLPISKDYEGDVMAMPADMPVFISEKTKSILFAPVIEAHKNSIGHKMSNLYPKLGKQLHLDRSRYFINFNNSEIKKNLFK